MWYTCTLYDGTGSLRGKEKIIFRRKIQIKAGREGVNHDNVRTKFAQKYRHHLRNGYLLIMDDKRGIGCGMMYYYDTYWYIKYKGNPIRVERGGGFSIGGEWDGWLHGIHDVTRFLQKSHAVDNIKLLRQHKSKDDQKKFKLVKVVSK